MWEAQAEEDRERVAGFWARKRRNGSSPPATTFDLMRQENAWQLDSKVYRNS